MTGRDWDEEVRGIVTPLAWEVSATWMDEWPAEDVDGREG